MDRPPDYIPADTPHQRIIEYNALMDRWYVALSRIPPYREPTIDDLAILRKGGGGSAVDRAYWSVTMWQRWERQRRWWKPWTW